MCLLAEAYYGTKRMSMAATKRKTTLELCTAQHRKEYPISFLTGHVSEPENQVEVIERPTVNKKLQSSPIVIADSPSHRPSWPPRSLIRFML